MIALLIFGIGYSALSANAQSLPTPDRTGVGRPSVDPPRFLEPTKEEAKRPRRALPEIETLIPSDELERAFGEQGMTLRGFRIVGSQIFEEHELAAAVAPFLDRTIYSESLSAISDAITRMYVDAGYVGSGAVIPDQSIENGILEVRVIEGEVSAISVQRSGRLRSRWVESRVRKLEGRPLQLSELDHTLRILQKDPRVERVDAVLTPGEDRGESIVRLDVVEANPWTMDLRAANDLAPALGGRRGMLTIEHRNVLGFGDTFSGSITGSRGLVDFDLGYSFPITPWLTELVISGGRAEGEVIEGDFASVGFRNEIENYGVSLVQPLFVGLEDEVRLGGTLERRTSRLTFTDQSRDFLLETAGGDGSEIRLLMLRFDLDWVHRELDRVFAARLRTTFGLDGWDATTPNDTPFGLETLADGEFTSWLLQLQYAQRVETPLGAGEVVARGDLQLATGSLFAMESFAMGGVSSIRGYHENAIISDNGWLASVEFRLPILPAGLRPHELRLAPFVDAGFAWDDDDDLVPSRDRFDRFYASVGFGLLYNYGNRFEMRAYFGEPLVRDVTPQGDRLQDRGIHLEATISVF